MDSASYASSPHAREAIREAAGTGRPYEFLIADYQMPDLDGARLASAIKTDPLPATRSSLC
jgi:CheY-like chemotaxis protein